MSVPFDCPSPASAANSFARSSRNVSVRRAHSLRDSQSRASFSLIFILSRSLCDAASTSSVAW